MKILNKFLGRNNTKVNFLSIALGNFFYYGIQYFILILLTKNFDKSLVGLYIFALAFVKPIFIPLNLQLRSLFVTETNDNLTISDYHSIRFLGNILTLLTIYILSKLSSVDSVIILLQIGMIKILESQSEMCHAIFQKKQEMVFIGLSRIVSGTITIIMIIVGIKLELQFSSIINLWILGLIAVLLLLDIPKARNKDKDFLNLKKYFNWTKVKSILKFAWPLFFLEIISKFYESYPSLSVEKYFGLEMLAVFGSIIYFKAIGGQILTQIINIVEPKMANFWKNNQFEEFNKLVLKLVVLGFLIGIIIIIILNFTGEMILQFLFTEEYSKHNKLLVLIAISSCISYLYSFLSTSLTCMRKHYIKLPIRLLGLITLMLLTFINRENITIYSFIYYLIYAEIILGILHFISYFYYLNTMKNKA